MHARLPRAGKSGVVAEGARLMTGPFYTPGLVCPELVEIVKIDVQKGIAVIKVRMLELRIRGGSDAIEEAGKPKGKVQARMDAKVDAYNPVMFENPEIKLGGFGGERIVSLPLGSILTREEKKDKALMERIWRHGDAAEFAARYRATNLEDALDWFYRKVLIKLRMITPTSLIASRLEYLKPMHHRILEQIDREKAAEAKENDAINEVVNPSAAGGLRQELAAT